MAQVPYAELQRLADRFLEEARKYTKTGQLYANQRSADETPEEYRIRLAEDIAADPEKYYQRRIIPRLEDQILDFRQDAWQTGRAIREAELAGRSPRNPEACFRWGQCPYWDACANGLDLTTSPDFISSENVHPELTEVVSAIPEP